MGALRRELTGGCVDLQNVGRMHLTMQVIEEFCSIYSLGTYQYTIVFQWIFWQYNAFHHVYQVSFLLFLSVHVVLDVVDPITLLFLYS